MLNNKLEETNEEYQLEKCPVNGSTVRIRITSECLGERAGDTQSQASLSMMRMPSTLSIQSVDKTEQKPKSSEIISDSKKKEDKEELEEARKKIGQLTEENKKLNKELQ